MRLANMGVRQSESGGSWDVSFCYYGMLNDDGSYVTFNEATGQRVTITPKARWSVESLSPNNEATANALWAINEKVTALVAEQDPRVPKAKVDGPLSFLVDVWGRDTGGIPQARLSVKRLDDGRWSVSEYDWNRWSAILD